MVLACCFGGYVKKLVSKCKLYGLAAKFAVVSFLDGLELCMGITVGRALRHSRNRHSLEQTVWVRIPKPAGISVPVTLSRLVYRISIS